MRSIRLEYHGILLHIILLLMILRELYINITISIFHKYQVYCTLIKRREPFFSGKQVIAKTSNVTQLSGQIFFKVTNIC